jgi:hypothetical protein
MNDGLPSAVEVDRTVDVRDAMVVWIDEVSGWAWHGSRS